MNVYFLNVGYGEAIIVRSNDVCAVIDGGPSADRSYCESDAVRLTDFIEYLGIKRIDLIVLTHPHDDHVGGLAPILVNESVSVGEIWSCVLPDSIFSPDENACKKYVNEPFFGALRVFQRFRDDAARRGIPVIQVDRDSPCKAIGAITFLPLGMSKERARENKAAYDALFTESDSEKFAKMLNDIDCACNSTSLALRITDESSGHALLLTGDKVDGWEELKSETSLKADVLKLTHHGQYNGMPEAMLTGADPSIIVTCANKARSFNSARADVLDRARSYLTERGQEPRVYVTGDIGANALCIKLGKEITTEMINI